MKRVLIATATILSLGGYAVAQEAPQIYGDFSPSVENSLQNNEVNNGQATPLPDLGVDLMPTASVDDQKSDGDISAQDTLPGSTDPNLKGR